ncbi:MAG: hypothetical protein E7289_05940 [Lachnospiraceae bacterium]|nr:hypothetical protein [Lachnospiraceae bacterium]
MNIVLSNPPTIKEMTMNIKSYKTADNFLKIFQELVKEDRNFAAFLKHLDAYDSFTYNHSINVGLQTYIGHLILDSFTKKCIIWGYFIHPNLRTDRQYGSFKDGYFYLLPECMRFYANSKIANVFTIGSALLFVYGMYWYLANQPLNMLLSMIS